MPKKTAKTENQAAENGGKKRRGGVKAGIGALIIGLILALLRLLGYLGLGPDFGLGTGKVSGNSESSVSATQDISDKEAETEAATEPETEEVTEAPAIEYVEVKVSGGTIMYNGEEVSADDVVSAAKSAGEDAIIRITDNDATQNAMEALKTVLDNNSVNYIIVE